ncbi:hypothetical protein [Paenibacillus marinisediminis]
MQAGFVIECLNCGRVYRVIPGSRDYRNEAITFGTDNYGADHMACECGNAVEEHSQFKGKQFESDFEVEWRSISR